MFSGIIEATSKITKAWLGDGALLRIQVERPSFFNDIRVGDSIAINGVCLTVETFNENFIQFALAAETLKILQLPLVLDEMMNSSFLGKILNLERSLKFGDRIHGHLVSGHVDSLALVCRAEKVGGNFFLEVALQNELLKYTWKKGSITLNGVSLTINEVNENKISVCLIPETLLRTNLGELNAGDHITVEPDYFAKGLFHFQQESIKNFQKVSQ